MRETVRQKRHGEWILMGLFLLAACGFSVMFCVWASFMVVEQGYGWFLVALVPMGLFSAALFVDSLIKLFIGRSVLKKLL